MPDKPHPMGHWRYLLQNGKNKKAIREHPSRERLAIRKALVRMGVRWREAVMFRNPHYRGYKGETERAPQWLDFVVFASHKKAIVILFDIKRTLHIVPPRRHIEAYNAKKKFLALRGMPLLIVPRSHSAQEYEIVIRNFVRKEV